MNIENTLQNEFEKLILSFFLFLHFNHMVGQLVFLTLIIPPLLLLINPFSCFALIVAHQHIPLQDPPPPDACTSCMTIDRGEEGFQLLAEGHLIGGQQKNDRDKKS